MSKRLEGRGAGKANGRLKASEDDSAKPHVRRRGRVAPRISGLGRTTANIAKRLKRSPGSVRGRALRLGIALAKRAVKGRDDRRPDQFSFVRSPVVAAIVNASTAMPSGNVAFETTEGCVAAITERQARFIRAISPALG